MDGFSVVLLGAGNVASFLLHALKVRGITVEKIIARDERKVSALAAGTGTPWSCDFSDTGSEKNIVISAVSDSAAQELWSRCDFGERLVLHTAGTLPLRALKKFAVNCGVLYPLQSISAKNLPESSCVPFLVEADSPENLEKVRSLARLLSPQVYECTSEKREKLHLAAVFANNFSNLCFRIAWELAEKERLPPELLLPLIEETCRKLHRMTPAEAQTGPARRSDGNVMQKHLELLADMPETAGFYRLASSEIRRREK